MKSNNPDIEDFQVATINLQRIVSHNIENRWYYKITFRELIDSEVQYEKHYLPLIVLMDGKIIEAETVK